jgi:hypothetical protein
LGPQPRASATSSTARSTPLWPPEMSFIGIVCYCCARSTMKAPSLVRKKFVILIAPDVPSVSW